jgi:ubiquinone/menaquinone biosynthesis C-methylase UbiE
MQWKDQAQDRFSTGKDATKWSDMYTTDKPSIDALNFRKRRDFTVDYVRTHFLEGARILDLGCGAGPVLVKLCTYNYQLIGIDYSNDMLCLARQQLGAATENVLLLQGECERIPLPDASNDCIVCLGVISYAESIDVALHEIYRVLTPGGTAIVTYRNAFNAVFMDPVAFIHCVIRYPFCAEPAPVKTIGRAIARKEVLDNIHKTHFKILLEQQIGFGSLRFNRKVLFDGKCAIRVNNVLHKLLHGLGLKRLYRAMADVHIIVLQK